MPLGLIDLLGLLQQVLVMIFLFVQLANRMVQKIEAHQELLACELPAVAACIADPFGGHEVGLEVRR